MLTIRHFTDDDKRDKWAHLVAPVTAEGFNVDDQREGKGPTPVSVQPYVKSQPLADRLDPLSRPCPRLCPISRQITPILPPTPNERPTLAIRHPIRLFQPRSKR